MSSAYDWATGTYYIMNPFALKIKRLKIKSSGYVVKTISERIMSSAYDWASWTYYAGIRRRQRSRTQSRRKDRSK